MSSTTANLNVEDVALSILLKYLKLEGKVINSCSTLSISLHSFLITAAFSGRTLEIDGKKVLSCHLRNIFGNDPMKEHTYNVFYCGTPDEQKVMTIDLSIGQYKESSTLKDSETVKAFRAVAGECRLTDINGVALSPENHDKVGGLVNFPDYRTDSKINPGYKEFLSSKANIVHGKINTPCPEIFGNIFKFCQGKWGGERNIVLSSKNLDV